MMENEPWPVKYPQSVTKMALERTDDSLNNGSLESPSEKNTESLQDNVGEDNKNVINGTSKETATRFNVPSVTISERAKQTIKNILEQVKSLSQVEKYLLFLKLPAEVSNIVDPLRQPLNPLGSRSEIYTTISWIRTHLEEDPDISLPKQQVYDEYNGYCTQIKVKPLSQADFGKVMKQVYPKVRARRLGTRGNSRYCYSGLRRCIKLKAPMLPDLADKPLSTEAPCSQFSLTAAAWLIVKEWSEQKLGLQFSSLQALAFHLILNHSVGAGSEAACKLTSATESHMKGEETTSKCGNKHREMQLQLQRKIQQKNEINKERKRKIQSPKTEQKGCKKQKTQQAVPIALLNSNSNTETSPTDTGSTSTSPITQDQQPICDKSVDFTQAPPLPDFDNFQRPAHAADGDAPPDILPALTGKVAIPRLQGNTTIDQTASVVPRGGRNAKYKAIQPKLQPCDIASYNPQGVVETTEDGRSQQTSLLSTAFTATRSQQSVPPVVAAGVPQSSAPLVSDGLNESQCSDEDNCDVSPDFPPLSRERLNSVSTVDKDAMDEYLGTNNSQHEEELSKYFSNNNNINEPSESDNKTKLSQLRQLLQQNGIAAPLQNIAVPIEKRNANPLSEEYKFSTSVVAQVPVESTGRVGFVQHQRGGVTTVGGHARRRVSFETQVHEEPVPPSPNTRRRNFSFMPISPGPQSPNATNGMQSKCSSNNVSPFVSPRNTPVARAKVCATLHQNPVAQTLLAPKKMVKIKKEQPELSLDIPTLESSSFAPFVGKSYMPMSAPASPMLNTKSVLHKLLNSSTKVIYTPDYNGPPGTNNPNEASNEFFVGDAPNHLDIGYRSQSVPLHQMLSLKNNFPVDDPLISDLPTQTSASNDFTEIDPIADTESDNVNRIINSLDEPHCENNNINSVFNIDLTSNNHNLPEFGLHLINNNIDDINEFTAAAAAPPPDPVHIVQVPCSRNMTRSQSMDVNITYEPRCNPSRSVPSTPLPFLLKTQATSQLTEEFVRQQHSSSRSYPSTPLSAKPDPYNYNINNGDCLLNGQPIRTDEIEFIGFTSTENNMEHMAQEKNFGVEGGECEYEITENVGHLIDGTCVLIDQNYNGLNPLFVKQ